MLAFIFVLSLTCSATGFSVFDVSLSFVVFQALSFFFFCFIVSIINFLSFFSSFFISFTEAEISFLRFPLLQYYCPFCFSCLIIYKFPIQEKDNA